MSEPGLQRYRAIWISDLHLGTRGCRAEDLYRFLAGCAASHIYLVGDIVDGWSLRRSWFWTPAQDASRAARSWREPGPESALTYVPGNHDEDARELAGTTVAGVRVEREAVHTNPWTAGASARPPRRVRRRGAPCAPWLAHLGDRRLPAGAPSGHPLAQPASGAGWASPTGRFRAS